MKSKHKFTLLASIVCMSVGGCTSEETLETAIQRPPFTKIELTRSQKEAVSVNNQFAFDILKSMNSNSSHSDEINKVISPLSLYTLVSMMANGADVEARDELVSALCGKDSQMGIKKLNELNNLLINRLPSVDPSTTFSIYSSHWFDSSHTCYEEFSETLSSLYLCECYYEDFKDKSSVKSKINRWVSSSTNGLIKDFIPAIAANDINYLVNALYFKGVWSEKFPTENTKKGIFHSTLGDEKVDVMHATLEVQCGESHDADYVELPFGSGNFNFFIIYPKEGVDIESCINGLDPVTFNGLLSSSRGYELSIEIPKFTVGTKHQLSESDLSHCGISSIFSNGLSKICKESKVNVDALLAATSLSVDEAGAEAAAASTALVYGSVGLPKKRITIDRPFVFGIQEISTRALIMFGKIASINN